MLTGADAAAVDAAVGAWLAEHAAAATQRPASCSPPKHNQPTLFAALDALPWADTHITHRDIDRSHGRITTRTIQVRPAPNDLPFPHVNQVWLVERSVHDPAGTLLSAIAALGVTNLTADQTNPKALAGLIRNR